MLEIEEWCLTNSSVLAGHGILSESVVFVCSGREREIERHYCCPVKLGWLYSPSSWYHMLLPPSSIVPHSTALAKLFYPSNV